MIRAVYIISSALKVSWSTSGPSPRLSANLRPLVDLGAVGGGGGDSSVRCLSCLVALCTYYEYIIECDFSLVTIGCHGNGW